MCFSATASFTAAAILAPAGLLAISKAKPKERLFAAVPLIFAVQQAIEGIQWLFIGRGEICTPASYGFLFFALLVWPILIPLATYLMEPDAKRKQQMVYFGVLGTAVAGCLLVLTLMGQLSVTIYQNSIFYNLGYSNLVLGTLGLLYVISVSSSIRSSHFWVRATGMVLIFSAALSSLLYTTTFTSTWCFFSAWVSLMVLGYFFRPKVGSSNRRILGK